MLQDPVFSFRELMLKVQKERDEGSSGPAKFVKMFSFSVFYIMEDKSVVICRGAINVF